MSLLDALLPDRTTRLLQRWAGRPAGAKLQQVVTKPGWFSAQLSTMGTAVSAELWAADAAEATAALDAVMAEMQRINDTFSPHLANSELTRINREAAHHPVALSEEMTRLLGRALDLSALSDGAFDITYAAVGQHYDYRAGTAPDAATLTNALACVDWRLLELDRQAGTLRFGRPGMRIDLGGFAKGHAVDNAVALLRQRGIHHAMVAAGGDSHVLGDRRGRPWTVAIRDPRQAGEAVAVLPLQDTAVSTSGDYERFFERGGLRHHHLLDPRTGQSPRDVRSVTVLGDDGLSCEALSKTVFVMGRRRGLALIDSLPGLDAVVVDADGALHFSAGLQQALA
ncbi:FAD:protein FMN transferase [Ideonella margarita]|uniref:FAD:protein FMN transferase n=1 Tax=Ideonella margarita TaxID=2984191 RepID=A0ABU9C4W0_9BURK